MRPWIRQIHIYSGLLVSPYLIILGLSVFNFNHRNWFPDYSEGQTAVSYSIDLAAARERATPYLDSEIPPYIHDPSPTFVEDRALAQAVRDELGLYGHIALWKIHRQPEGVLSFPLQTAFGHGFSVLLNEAEGAAYVTPRGQGLWPVTLALHGLYKVPNSPLLSTWGYYTEVMVWVGLFFGASGLYLWFQRSRERLAGLVAFFVGLTLSVLLMFYAWSGVGS